MINLKELFKKKKGPSNEEHLDLNDDIYIDEEMKTFNPEEQNYDEGLETMTTSVETNQVHTNVMQRAVQDRLKVESIKVDFAPLTYNEIQKAASMLQLAQRIVLSVEKMSAEDRSRTLNFFAGMVYALNGNVEHYSKNIFIFEVAPKNN